MNRKLCGENREALGALGAVRIDIGFRGHEEAGVTRSETSHVVRIESLFSLVLP